MNNRFVQLLQMRLDASLEENKRTSTRYSDLREFAYSSIESLLRHLNTKNKQLIQNSNLNVYKQLFEKERKHFMEAKSENEKSIEKMQVTCK